MKRIIIVCLLFIIPVLSAGCWQTDQANGIKDAPPPLTEAEIDEIIASATKSVIVDIDLSQVSKPDPAQQRELNERMRFFGESLKGKVTLENKKIVVARVNGEFVFASDWYLEEIDTIVRAKYGNKDTPSNAEIFNDLIETKVISSTARSLGIYPPEEQIKAYIADQRKYMEELQLEEIIILIQAWGISEEEYYLLMEDRFADSLAKINWGVYLNKYDNEMQDDKQGYIVESPARIDADKIKPLVEKAKVEVTSEGRHLGL